MKDRDARLRASLSELRAFLGQAGMPAWDERLHAIQARITDPQTRRQGLIDLEQSFGGMGSLYDIYICDDNDNVPAGQSPEVANAKASRLLDAVFRELKLADASPITRLVWRWCAWRFRRRPGPRITAAFRRS